MAPTFRLLGPLVQQGNWHHHQYMSPTGARRVHGLYQCTGLPELESQCASGNRNRWTVYSTIPSRQEEQGKLGMVDPIALKSTMIHGDAALNVFKISYKAWA